MSFGLDLPHVKLPRFLSESFRTVGLASDHPGSLPLARVLTGGERLGLECRLNLDPGDVTETNLLIHERAV